MVNGINHITLSVKNLERSFAFYRDALGFKPLMKSTKSAYFLAGDMWFCIEEDLQTYGATQFKTNSSEGNSFYFTDPDGYKLELHVGSWKSRLEGHKKRGDLKGFEFFE